MEPEPEKYPTIDSSPIRSNEGPSHPLPDSNDELSRMLGLDSDSGNYLQNNEQYKLFSKSFQDLQVRSTF